MTELERQEQFDLLRRQTDVAYQIKDSGIREQYAGGMIRDTAEGKINWALVADGPMLRRWAQHLTNGAKKYAKRNWMLGQGQEELERAKESAFRHFVQWYLDEKDEDHASATFFNINQVEELKRKMKNGNNEPAVLGAGIGSLAGQCGPIQGVGRLPFIGVNLPPIAPYPHGIKTTEEAISRAQKDVVKQKKLAQLQKELLEILNET